jgi:hypothetical protein
MNKIGRYKVLASDELIVEYYSGTLTVDDLIYFKETISKEPGYDFYFNSILDFRDSTLDMSKADLITLNEYFDRKFNNNKSLRRVVYLVNSNKSGDMAILFRFTSKKTNMDQMTFATVGSTVKWFNDERVNLDLIKNILDELKESGNNVFDASQSQ